MLGTRKPSLAPSLSCVFNFPAVVNSRIYSTHGAPLPFYRGCVSFSCTGYFTACVRRASELLLRGLIYPQDCLRRLFQRQVALKFSSVTLNSLGCPTSSLCSIPHLTLEEFCIRRRQMSPQVLLRTSRLVSTVFCGLNAPNAWVTGVANLPRFNRCTYTTGRSQYFNQP